MTRLARLSAALLLGVPVLAALALLSVAPRASAGGGCHGVAGPHRTDAAETQIKVGPCFFAPTVARVPVGATVTFFNDETTHLITGANGEWGSPDVVIGPRQETSFTFDEPGIYPYACALHSGMSGAIVVGDVAGPAAVAGPPDGAGAPSEPPPPPLESSNLVAGVAMVGLALAVAASAASPVYCALYAKEYVKHAAAESKGSLSPGRVHDRAYSKCLNMDDEPLLPTAYAEPPEAVGGPFVEEEPSAPPVAKTTTADAPAASTTIAASTIAPIAIAMPPRLMMFELSPM